MILVRKGVQTLVNFQRFASTALLLLLLLLLPARPSVAQVSITDRLRFSGYGEVHYNNPATGTMNQDAPAEADVHRLVLGWVYEFSPGFRVDVEVDYEHAAQEIELEYAFLDCDLSSSLTLRTGSVLMPVGPLNEFHEPTLFYSVERPYVERSIMPTTWQEIGVGIVGRTGSGAVSYRGYVVTGLNAAGFTSLNGIRGGRSKGFEAPAEDLAAVARVEYASTSGLTLGASGYYGGADQGDAAMGDVTLGIGSADVRFRRSGLDLRGVFYRTMLDGADAVSTVNGATIGEAMMGWYAEAAYDILRRDAADDRKRSLVVFGRFEDFDTQEEIPTGPSFVRDPEAGRQVITGGLAFYPIDKVAFKTDFEHWTDDSDAVLNRFNFGAAFRF
jgi:hypothetical protein